MKPLQFQIGFMKFFIRNKNAGCDRVKVVQWILVISASLAVLSSGGCADNPGPFSQDQAVGVMLSGTAIPGQQVSASLQPNFALTADQAALQVAPVTQEASLAALQAIGLSGSIGALVGPAAAAQASLPSPQAPTGIPTGPTLPTPMVPITGFSVDPMLK